MTPNKKIQEKNPLWVQTLLKLMAAQGMNPRQLSLLTGLNPTAVRDFLTERVKHPRYETQQALARVLQTTPAHLLTENTTKHALSGVDAAAAENLDLLTEIIARVQDVADDMGRELSPRELATMVTTISANAQQSHRAHTNQDGN